MSYLFGSGKRLVFSENDRLGIFKSLSFFFLLFLQVSFLLLLLFFKLLCLLLLFGKGLFGLLESGTRDFLETFGILLDLDLDVVTLGFNSLENALERSGFSTIAIGVATGNFINENS